MSKPKFELICKDDGANKVFVLKNVSSVIVSGINADSFELVCCDRDTKDLLLHVSNFPTSIGPNETKEFLCSHPALKRRRVGYNTIRLIFTMEDEQLNKYKCIATKSVEEERGFLIGNWDMKVETVQEDT